MSTSSSILFQNKWNIINIPLYRFSTTGEYIEAIGHHPHFPKQTPSNFDTIPPHTRITPPTFLLYFTQENVAHSMCQLIKNYYEYEQQGQNRKVLLSACTKTMPFLDMLIKILLPSSEIEYMQEGHFYYFDDIYIPSYIWFTECIGYESTYNQHNHTRTLHTDGVISPEYKDLYDPLKLFDARIQDIIQNQAQTQPHTNKNIFMIKSAKCTNSQTPGRAIILTPDTDEVLSQHNYMTVHTDTIRTKEDVIQHIQTLRNAENIITSYGGANCCNRFFFNPNAIVKVICNMHYRSEYQNEWHPRCSAYRAKQYIFFLDRPNTITARELSEVIEY
jgi:hypothetical protein